MIWLVLSLLVLIGFALAIYPLLRRARIVEGHEDVAVYRRQLAEIDADRARGLLDDDAAAAARVEVERRILKSAAGTEATVSRPLPRLVTVFLTLSVLTAAILLYVNSGSPLLPAAPALVAADQVIDTGTAKVDMRQAMDRLLAYLVERPDDLEGWGHVRRLAPMLRREGDYAQGLEAAVAAQPKDGTLRALYAESLIAMGGGQIGPAARLALREAAAVEPANPSVRYYTGMMYLQDGQEEAAAAEWRALLDDSPPEAPWRGQVEARLSRLGGESARAAAASDLAALPPEERLARIRGMVEGLAARLRPVADDREGWARLARAYSVLGEAEKAKAAHDTALKLAREAGDAALIEALQQDGGVPVR